MNIGHAIKIYRTRRGLNQGQLSVLTGLSDSYISLLERGKRDPTLDSIKVIAQALNVPMIILVFVASSEDETGLSRELCEKLSYASLSV